VLVGASLTELVGFEVIGPRGRIVVTAVAFGSFSALFLPKARAGLTARRVVFASTSLVAIAVIAPPAGSHDIWSYAMYGRLVSVHHVSPYTHVPGNFVRDPFLHLVARGWRHTGSVYGPAFAAVSAIGTALTGSSELATRLFFQLLEAAALAAALLVVWRRTRDPVALAFIALNPGLIVAVNGGHNDILVGLALLAGTLMLADGHPRRAGSVLAAGALVKLVAMLPLVALVLWTWRRRGSRPSIEAGATACIVVVVAYLASGRTDALGPLLHASKQHSRSSLWQLATQWLARPIGLTQSVLFRIEGDAALVVVATFVVVVVFWMTRSGSSTVYEASTGVIVAVTAVLAFLFAGAYILPWYSAWALMPVALVWNSRLAALAAGQAALISAAYAAPLVFGAVLSTYAQDLVPAVLLGALAYLAWSAGHDRLRCPMRVRRRCEPDRVVAAGPNPAP